MCKTAFKIIEQQRVRLPEFPWCPGSVGYIFYLFCLLPVLFGGTVRNPSGFGNYCGAASVGK